MSDLHQSPTDMWTIAGALSGLTDAESFFPEFAKWIQTASPDTQQARGILETALRALTTATEDDLAAAEEIIIRYVLPRCLEEDHLIPTTVAEPHLLREYLAKWIEQYPEEKKVKLRTQVITEAYSRLLSSNSEAAIWTISAIGFRSPEIEQALLRATGIKDQIGDAALSCLAGLRPAEEIEIALVRKTIRRISERGLGNLGFAVHELSSPLFIPVLGRLLRKKSSGSERQKAWDQMRAVALLARIAQKKPNDSELQARVWKVLKAVVSKDTPSQGTSLLTGDGIAWCNTKEVTQFLITIFEHEEKNSFLICKRLQDCVLPEQLLGWQEIDKSRLKRVLTEEATALIGGNSRSMTVESHLRQLIWEIGFAAGITDIADWLSAVLENETNPFALRDIVSFASFLRLNEIPSRVEALVRERIDIKQGSDEPLLSARIEAMRVLRAAASWQAFEALLASGLTFQGTSLRSTSEAVADVAERLSIENAERVIFRLMEVSGEPSAGHRRVLAIVGLRRLAAENHLSEGVLQHLIKLANDRSLPEYARAYAVWSLGCFTASSKEATDCLLAYANDSRTDIELRFQSLDALLRRGEWGGNEPTFLNALEIQEIESTVPVEVLRTYQAWQGLLLVNLFRVNPAEFFPHLRDLITHGRGEVVHVVLRRLGEGTVEARSMLKDLAKCAISRATERLGKSFGETDNFEYICRMSPDEFADTRWERTWNEWMPAVRASVADAIGHVFSTDRHIRLPRIRSILTALLGDANYQVRRAAARAYSRCDRVEYRSVSEKWAGAGNSELRRRAAEMGEWVEPDDQTGLDNHILRLLSHDPEPSVRNASESSIEALRNRIWRIMFFQQLLLARSDDGNTWLSKAFCYGRALTKIGDDETLLALRELEVADNVPLNVQNWLESVREDLQTHWQDVTRRWPDPWLPWSGQLEEVDGNIRAGERVLNVHMSLWCRRADDPRGVSAWGGGFRADFAFLSMAIGAIGDRIVIEIEGREKASAIISAANLPGQIFFLGTGAYPAVT